MEDGALDAILSFFNHLLDSVSFIFYFFFFLILSVFFFFFNFILFLNLT